MTSWLVNLSGSDLIHSFDVLDQSIVVCLFHTLLWNDQFHTTLCAISINSWAYNIGFMPGKSTSITLWCQVGLIRVVRWSGMPLPWSCVALTWTSIWTLSWLSWTGYSGYLAFLLIVVMSFQIIYRLTWSDLFYMKLQWLIVSAYS